MKKKNKAFWWPNGQSAMCLACKLTFLEFIKSNHFPFIYSTPQSSPPLTEKTQKTQTIKITCVLGLVGVAAYLESQTRCQARLNRSVSSSFSHLVNETDVSC